MTQGESLISMILAVIAYLLFQIAKQLTYLTGKKIRSPFSGLFSKQMFKPKQKIYSNEKEEKLPN
jgi:hypothetical protein